MINKNCKYVNIPDGFSLFHPMYDENCWLAISNKDIDYLDTIRRKFLNQEIPDDYTVDTLKVGKTGQIKKGYEEYCIIENQPVKYKINQLIPDTIGTI
jgi:hypothetical protein